MNRIITQFDWTRSDSEPLSVGVTFIQPETGIGPQRLSVDNADHRIVPPDICPVYAMLTMLAEMAHLSINRWMEQQA